MDKKYQTHIYAASKRFISDKKTYRLQVRGWKMVFHANGNKRKAGVTMLISEKIYFKTKAATRDKEGYYIK